MKGRDVELVVSEHQTQDMLAYERLLGDAMRGDAHLFAREDAIEQQWRIVDPVLDQKTAPHIYEPGTWGPSEATHMTEGVLGGWYRPEDPHRDASEQIRRAS
jgi:glucose-6-phosphate 1-dehydrogenase